MITVAEGAGAYGPVQVSLTTEGDTSADSALAVDRFPVRDASYTRTIDVSDDVVSELSDPHIVIHGVDENGNGEYDGDAVSSSTRASPARPRSRRPVGRWPSCPPVTRTPVASQTTRTAPAPAELPRGVDPAGISIPAIDVDARVTELGLKSDRSVEVPSDFDLSGWVRHTPRPGELGSWVIVGHIDSTSGPAVFFRLDELTAGDEIHVRGEEGERVTFVVDRIRQYAKAEFPFRDVFGYVRRPGLRLITCGGPFDEVAGSYEDNVVVYAHRTDPGS